MGCGTSASYSNGENNNKSYNIDNYIIYWHELQDILFLLRNNQVIMEDHKDETSTMFLYNTICIDTIIIYFENDNGTIFQHFYDEYKKYCKTFRLEEGLIYLKLLKLYLFFNKKIKIKDSILSELTTAYIILSRPPSRIY